MTQIVKLLAIILFLLLVTLSLNFSLLPNLNDYDNKRVLELLLISAVLFWIILGGMRTAPACLPGKTQTRYAAYLLIALACVSAFLSASPRHAVLEIGSFAGLFYVCRFTVVLWRGYHRMLVKWMVHAILLIW